MKIHVNVVRGYFFHFLHDGDLYLFVVEDVTAWYFKIIAHVSSVGSVFYLADHVLHFCCNFCYTFLHFTQFAWINCNVNFGNNEQT